MKSMLFIGAGLVCLATVSGSAAQGSGAPPGLLLEGMRLFQQETFDGNGRTCQTCHSELTGTVSPEDARQRFAKDPNDPLFLHDGSDDGLGHGVLRMLNDATVLVTVPLAPNVRLADNPAARSVVLRRGIATTLNTPALDPVLMLDGREPGLESQAAGAIASHAQALPPSQGDLHAIAEFQKTNRFFTSPALRRFALESGPAPALPQGRTASEKRGRRFFEDVGPDPNDFRPGLCSHCHSGPLLNQTNEFADDFIVLPPFLPPIPAGARFMNVGVSEFNVPLNPVRNYIFNPGPDQTIVPSPDPGRALITGLLEPFPLQQINAFKISPLRGIRRTAPYFHDNSARTLEDVAAHYANFFFVVTNGGIVITPDDQRDIVAFLKLLD
jgi:cytochrome c peroxidase